MSKLMTEYGGQYSPAKFFREGNCYESCKDCCNHNSNCKKCAIQECFDKLAIYEGIGELDEIVKVVQCKDCKHYESNMPWCNRLTRCVYDDDYCSGGEKREMTKSQYRRIKLQEESSDDLMDEVYLDKAIDFEEGLQDE